MDKIEPEPNSGCWLWVSGFGSGTGYARIWWHGATRDAHRVVYELERGPIPAGLTLDHRCRVRSCVNPDHLDPASDRVNILRGEAPPAINARKTACPRCGGPYTTEKDGKRCCRACHAEWHRRRRAGRVCS